MSMNNVPVIIAGGSGSRLWPLSRVTYPKQFIALADESKSLLQTTLERACECIPDVSPPIIVCNQQHRFLVAEQCRQLGIEPMAIILEPIGKNTAPAVALAAEYVNQRFTEANLWIMPADHVMQGGAALAQVFQQAMDALSQSKLVTFGVTMTQPSTAYGYIQIDQANIGIKGWCPIKQFVEKPDSTTAKQFFAEGNYYWNSGMFAFSANTYLQQLQVLAPEIYQPVHESMASIQIDGIFVRPETQAFERCVSDSIDYAVMEKAANSAMVPFPLSWNDVGSWDALMAEHPADDHGNVMRGDVLTQAVHNSYLHAESRLLAVVGLDNVVVVETADAVLVADKSSSQDVKKIVEQLKQKQRVEADDHLKMFRPWGWYQTITESPGFKVKRIAVKPHQMLSLQRHQHRAEHWVVVSGQATVVNGEQRFVLDPDQSTYIPAKTIHQLANETDAMLEIVEVQTGGYLGEDDIERFADQYGRVGVSA